MHSTEDSVSGWRALQQESLMASPQVLPSDWYPAKQAAGVWHRKDGLAVMLSVEVKADDPRKWLHVSLSRRDRLPSWDDLRAVKDVFVGRDRTAIQVFPPAGEYVNTNPNVLHLWCCLNSQVLPDFRRHGTL